MRTLGIHASYGHGLPRRGPQPARVHPLRRQPHESSRRAPRADSSPGECVDVSDAVDAYTLEGAYASFEENVKGRLMPGFYADLAVLSDDIFTIDPLMIRRVKVDATMAGGRWVFERNA